MKKYIALIIIALMFVLGGIILGYEITMRNIKASSENGGVVLLEVYGQEWVYEE